MSRARAVPPLVRYAALVVAVTVPAIAAAQRPGFQEAYDKGTDAFQLGKHEEAWRHFTKARDLDPTKPGPYRWLGKTAGVLGRHEECIENAIQALRLSPTSRYASETIGDLLACRRALKRPELVAPIPEDQGAISVVCAVEGAGVFVDGLKKGATPLPPFPVNPGKHVVRLERKGFLPAEAEVDVLKGVVHDVVITLEADPDAPPEVDPNDKPRAAVKVGWIAFATNVGPRASITFDGQVVTPGPDGTIEQAPGVHVVVVRADGHETWRRRVRVVRGQKRQLSVKLRTIAERRTHRRYGYVALGIAAAAGAGGTVFGMLEGRTYDEARAADLLERERPTTGTLSPDVPEAERHTRQELADLEARGDRLALVSNVSYGVGVAALGASVYFFLRERSAERRGYDLPLAFVPTLSPGGFAGAQLVFTKELDF